MLLRWGQVDYNRNLVQVPDEYCVHLCKSDQIMLVDSSICPYACKTATYIENNKMVIVDGARQHSVEISLVQEDAITVNTEEELFGLAKLFSEIGGLSSFFFGFSCLVIFELLESCYRFWNRWIRRRSIRIKRERDVSRLSKSIAFGRGEFYTPRCVPTNEESPIFPCKNIQRMQNLREPMPSRDCDLTVLFDVDGVCTPVSIQ